MTTHYETMGLDRGATPAEVRARWKKLAAELHPDRARKGDDAARLTGLFAALSAAYAVLGDPARRRDYDASLDLTTDPCRTCAGKGRRWRLPGPTAHACLACGGSGRTPKKRGTKR